MTETQKPSSQALALDAYERGRTIGEINARLGGHDARLSAINGTVAGFVIEMHALTVAVQRVADQQNEAARVALATAAALANDVVSRRNASETAWRPWVRVFAVVAAMSSVVSALAVYFGFGPH